MTDAVLDSHVVPIATISSAGFCCPSYECHRQWDEARNDDDPHLADGALSDASTVTLRPPEAVEIPGLGDLHGEPREYSDVEVIDSS